MFDIGLSGVGVLITGANGGIGLEVTKIFLEQGCFVVAQFYSSDANLCSLKETLAADVASRLYTVQADLTSESAVSALFTQVDSEPTFPTLLCLVVNHAVYESKACPIIRMPLEQWNKTLTTNLSSSFLVVRDFLQAVERSITRAHIQQEDDRVSVILVGSTAGKYGELEHGDYAASKSAMMYGLLLSLKNEIVKIAPRARANCVAPGWVATPMAAEALRNRKVIYDALTTSPMVKIAQTADVAHQILAIASPRLSGHVTGQILMVDGGFEGRRLNTAEDIDRRTAIS